MTFKIKFYEYPVCEMLVVWKKYESESSLCKGAASNQERPVVARVRYIATIYLYFLTISAVGNTNMY